jgi:hypothetical protein
MRKWLAASACCLVLGCVNTSVQQLDQAIRPARSFDSVSLLLEKPDEPYTVIAVIDAKTGTVFDGFDDLREEIVAEAAKLGGEAVILGSESTDTAFIFTGIAMIQSDTRKLSGEVIVYEQG